MDGESPSLPKDVKPFSNQEQEEPLAPNDENGEKPQEYPQLLSSFFLLPLSLNLSFVPLSLGQMHQGRPENGLKTSLGKSTSNRNPTTLLTTYTHKLTLSFFIKCTTL
ncbi:hypothetical protein Dimus_039502 [Dionaea muscipula]